MSFKKNNSLIVIIIYTGILLYSVVIETKYRNEIKALQSELNDQLLLYRDLQKSFDNYVDQQQNQEIGRECAVTKTFRLITILEEYDADPEFVYVVMDQFQLFRPFVIKIPIRFYNILEVNQYYECDLKGTDKDDISDLIVMEIRKTDRSGLDQIQESCKVE